MLQLVGLCSPSRPAAPHCIDRPLSKPNLPCLETYILQLIVEYPEYSPKAKSGADNLEVIPEVILPLKLQAKGANSKFNGW